MLDLTQLCFGDFPRAKQLGHDKAGWSLGFLSEAGPILRLGSLPYRSLQFLSSKDEVEEGLAELSFPCRV